jgi:Na+-driven multidrug efflux pump
VYYENDFLKQDLERHRELILDGPVSTTILLLSLPTLMMGLIMSAIPMIGGLLLNNIIGTRAASAVTYCSPIVNIMAALAQGMSVVAMAIKGQSNGMDDFAAGRRVATQMILYIGIQYVYIMMKSDQSAIRQELSNGFEVAGHANRRSVTLHIN